MRTIHRTKAGSKVACLAAAAVLCFIPRGAAQGDGVSLELTEAKVALAALQKKVGELAEALRESESKVDALADGLAAANAESAQFRDSYRKIRLQLEALGVSVLDGSDSAVEQRLLQAVNDRRILQEDNAKLTDEVFALSEALLQFMKSSVGADPAARERAEAALKKAEEALRIGLEKGEAGELPGGDVDSPLQSARVVSVKADYGLIVFNVGRDHGVREGMPFRVVRKDRPIGSVMVVDVRDKICGAVVQRLASEEPFAVGDIGRVEAE